VKSKMNFCHHLIALGALIALAASLPAAAEVEIFRVESREGFAKGTLDDVSIDELGSLRLAHHLERKAAIAEPFVFDAAAHGDGWVLGTGNAGRVVQVDRDGSVEELFATAEPEVFAVAAAGGTVWAASSPAGKVYRHQDGETEVIFDPEESYVWDLAVTPEGDLLVATGLEGRLYRVSNDGTSELVAEVSDRHLRSIALGPGGAVYAGTAGRGLVLKIARDGSITTLHDGLEPEILSFARADDGTTYFAALASEASLVDLSRAAAAQAQSENAEEGEPAVTVATQETSQTVGSRAGGATGPRSIVYRLENGGAEEVTSFDDETVHALAHHGGELWIGTGQEGRLYRWSEDGRRLEADLDEAQITALEANGSEMAVVATNGSALYLLEGSLASEGTYTSSVQDAELAADFGLFTWWGEKPAGTAVAFSFRSGLSQVPDATWSSWTEPAEGRELGLEVLPEGQYVQWRAHFKGNGGASPLLSEIELSYRQRNVKPKISSLEVLDPGQILVPSTFNPQNQTFEPWSPNREGIFTTLRSENTQDESRLQTLWKHGYRTLRWKVEDANEDELSYTLSFRPEGDSGDWLTIVEELDQPYYSFDEKVLPDGRYRFRLEASDRPKHRKGDALEAAEISPPVVVDHTAPEIVSRERTGNVVEIEVRDAWSPLREAVVSIDAGEWQPALAADGMVDARREVLRVEVPEGARLVLLRLSDAAWNVVTFNLLDE